MKNWKEMIVFLLQGMSKAVHRFPLTVGCLSGATILIWYMISLDTSPSLTVEKAMYTLVVGAFLGMAAQFSAERFAKLSRFRPTINGIAVLLTAGYFLILWPAPQISQEITVRTLVAVFAMFCAMLWVPSCKEMADFNKVALIHFKGFFTSVLYSGVLTGGIAAIIAAVDILLFDVNSDAYSYMFTLVWVLFAPVYYLSLLPRFHSQAEADLVFFRKAESYPRFLEILVSYISIPLVTGYTLVLAAYFVKIIITMKWPSGQLGPMVLVYSAVGLILFVLASLPENRFAALYRRIFPKVLIPIVIMQLISVGIRLNAYGVTESRYYVALFGAFSIIIGIVLSLRPVKMNSTIALLAAGLAIISVIPPVDAFTVSRVSQITRIENILKDEGILAGGKLAPKENASEEAKIETTNILSYLDRQSSLKYIAWLPEDFAMYRNMKDIFGFEPTYPYNVGRDEKYFYAGLDTRKSVLISGYDVSLLIQSSRFNGEQNPEYMDFKLGDKDYQLIVKRISDQEVNISVQDSSGSELIQTGLYDFAKGVAETGMEPKEMLPPERMTLDVNKGDYKLKVIFQNINITFGTDEGAGADYSAIVLFGDNHS